MEQQHRIRINHGLQVIGPRVNIVREDGTMAPDVLPSRGTRGPVCSCGWVGQSWNTDAEAEQDGDEHVTAVT